MNLNETILSILSDSEPMAASEVIFEFVQDPHGLAAVPDARDIVTALESLTKTGEVVASWSHGGQVFRKRTGYQLEQWRAVQEKRQPEFRL